MKRLVTLLCLMCLAFSLSAQDDVAILMAVTDADNMQPGEVTVMTHFEDMGFFVDVRTSSDVLEGDGDGYNLIFIHEAISSSSIADKLKFEETPIMSTEFYIADDMALADPVGQTGDDPELPLEEFIFVEDTTHVIFHGIPAGEVVVFTEPAKFGWGVITDSEAQSLATLSYDDTRSILFTVEQGAVDANGDEVPERRAFFFMFNNTEQFMTDLGWELFDRTTAWCLHQDSTTVVSQRPKPPSRFNLKQNYPNPFNPTTSISYELDRDSQVMLNVYNLLGEKVVSLVDDHKAAGQHNVSFDASNLSSGIYLYKLQANDRVLTRKMVLAR